ncbi:XkdQ/YqbQ family protein [Bacilliculturomica massiliensis]|uniref:XkdQ/YqbQ family protein n=1 Tax=Bacilliculturomica massiliensis TaxID=1917867 RepID=UPI001FE36247|nr:hydrolase [Bacilliculturomica massiliensis]
MWETERRGAPGKLTFTVVKDGVLNFQEGDSVLFRVGETDVFWGYVFTKSRNKDGTIKVTAYDQLRYLKNKDTIQYEDMTASTFIKTLANDFKLTCGEIEDTKYVIPYRLEEDQTLFDMIQSALNETLQATNEMYVLYDLCGKLTLKNIGSMRVNLLIDKDAAENFDYSTSIDSETYNQVRLMYENDDAGERQFFQAMDSYTIGLWGVLQYFEKIDNDANAVKKANALLKYYNRKSRNLSIKNAFGDISVRGGSSVPVTLDLGDLIANTYMIVEKVKHTLSGKSHFMDLTLIGGDFIA